MAPATIRNRILGASLTALFMLPLILLMMEPRRVTSSSPHLRYANTKEAVEVCPEGWAC